jgi:hypothetical protein
MIAPGATPLGEEQIEVMLFELHKLLDFHGLVPLDFNQDSEDASIAVAK